MAPHISYQSQSVLPNIKEQSIGMQTQNRQHTMEKFLKNHQTDLTAPLLAHPPPPIAAELLSTEEIGQAAERIKDGKLVAFPTETVYGLGANALNAEALLKIYETKRRPLTDPIIVHVNNAQEARKLVTPQPEEEIIFNVLTLKFWPGPLTVILKANLEILPAMVTAQTGFVGLRSPKHPYARKLISESGLPIGAPSANLFSHVSPTEPVHVLNDFWDQDVAIVDGERCEFGVESTVVKLTGNELHVLREGSLSVSKLSEFLKAELGEAGPTVIVGRRIEKKGTNMVAPGQLLKHYAPNLPCYYTLGSGLTYSAPEQKQTYQVGKVAFISFHPSFAPLKNQCEYFFEVGNNLNHSEAELCEEEEELFCTKEEKSRMREIYYLLRRCENLPVEGILVGWFGPQEGAVWDKVFRSTQGREALPS